MKNINTLLFVFLLGLFGQANAATVANGGTFSFIGSGLEWTTDYIGNGSIDDDPDGNGVIDNVKITGSDTDVFGTLGITDMSTVLGAAGDISFDWEFTTPDFFGNEIFDFFFRLEITDSGGTFTTTQITDPLGGASQSGSFGNGGLPAISLAAGDLFSLSIETPDNFGGAAMVTISNFAFTGDLGGRGVVPVPPAVLLFGSALVGLMGFVRRKQWFNSGA